jgi:hypothetical protein
MRRLLPFREAFSPQTKTTRSIEPSLLSNQSIDMSAAKTAVVVPGPESAAGSGNGNKAGNQMGLFKPEVDLILKVYPIPACVFFGHVFRSFCTNSDRQAPLRARFFCCSACNLWSACVSCRRNSFSCSWERPSCCSSELTGVGHFDPHFPGRSIGEIFRCSDLEFACGGNRILFESLSFLARAYHESM